MGAGANCCKNRFQSTNEEMKCQEDPVYSEEVMFMNPKALAESEEFQFEMKMLMSLSKKQMSWSLNLLL